MSARVLSVGIHPRWSAPLAAAPCALRVSARPADRVPARLARCLPIAAALLIGACGTVPRGGYYQDDGPPKRPPVDVTRVPDAVPRAEPRSAYGNQPYTVFGVNYTPLADARGYRERGIASWYGNKFHGRRTSSGEPYDMYAMTAAHRTLPLPSYVCVRNLENGRSVIVRVNDRGPFLHNRLIDLSYAAATRLGVVGTGTAMVEVESVGPGASAAAAAAQPAFSPIRAAASATTDVPPRLSVQVGAFSQYDNAVNLKDRLERAGFNPVYIQSPAPGPGDRSASVYRVRIGPVATVERGDRLVADVARYGVADALLVVD